MAGAAAERSPHQGLSPIDDGDLRTLMSAAAFQARRVARTMRLAPSEREDVEHDILLIILERRRFFDPARSPWAAFADRIARQAAQIVADAVGATRRRRGPSLDPFDDADDDMVHKLALAPVAASPASEEVDLALSLERVVVCLPDDLRDVALLALDEDGDLAEAQHRSGLSSSVFYRRLREVRYRMLCADLVRLPKTAPGTSWEN